MTADVQEPRTSLDGAKFAGVALCVALGIGAFYYLGESGRLLRLLALLIPVLAAAALFLTTAQGRSLIGFGRDTQIEIRKVVWPSRQETIKTTGSIIAIVIVTALFLWMLDLMLGGFTRWLLGQGG
jgi:preprotein translocase subunit SecE